MLAHSFALWRRHALGFVGTSLLLLSPGIAYWYLAYWYFEPTTTPLHTMVAWGGTVFEYALTHLLAAAMAWVVHRRDASARGGSTTASRPAPRLVLAALGTSLLCTLQIMLLMLLLLVPGIMRLSQLFVAMPAVAIEGRNGTDAVRRSESLTRGTRWVIFGIWLLIRLVHILGGWLIGYLALTSGLLSATAAECLYWALQIAALALTSSTMVACWYLLRARHELPDARSLAAVFD